METYVIVIFAILVILTFVVSKNNRRFIIYSITGLKRMIDTNLYYQEKNIKNLYNNLYKCVTKNELEEYAKLYALKDEIIIKDDLQKYTLKDELEEYAKSYALKDEIIIKDDLKKYALKDDLANFNLKDDLKNYALKDEFVSKKDFLTYTLNNQQINKKSNIVEVKDNSQIPEIEKYKILSKIVDTLLKENKPQEITNKPQEIRTKDKIDEIMNEKLDTILPPSKLYDVYQPNWFK
jgi:hypothetical protein